MNPKHYKKAIWETRKKYQKPRLSKKQLAEAYYLGVQSIENRKRLQALIGGIGTHKGV